MTEIYDFMNTREMFYLCEQILDFCALEMDLG